MEYKTLGDVVHEALEEYSPTQGRFSKFKSSLDKFLAKNYFKVSLGFALACGTTGYFLFEPFSKFLVGPNKILSSEQIHSARLCGTIVFSGAGYVAARLSLPNHLGKRIYSKLKNKPKKEVKHRATLFRHPLIEGFALSTLATIIFAPKKIVLPPYTTSDLKMLGTYILGWGACAATAFYLLREVENQGKKAWNDLGASFQCTPAQIIGIFSLDKKIKILKKMAEKNNALSTKQVIARALLKKNLYEGLNYSKEVLDEMKQTEVGYGFARLNKWAMGITHSYLFKENENWLVFFDFLKRIQKEDKEAANKILEEVRKATPNELIDARFLLNYFSKDLIEPQQDKPWSDLARNIISLSKRDKNIQEFKSSEGRVWVYTGSKLINRALVLKEFEFDFFERFLKQKFEYETLRNTEIKTENPLVFTREDGKSLVMTTREGNLNLREAFKNKNISDRRQAFEKFIREGLLAQKLLYANLRKEKDCFYADVKIDNKLYSVSIDVLNLEENLLHRAFIGDEKRKKRFGENPYLESVLIDIGIYREENYTPIIITCNHGDYLGTNMTELFAHLDARHIIADALYDPTYGSFEPLFIDFDKDEKANVTFKGLNELYGFNEESRFVKSFDYLYLHNGLCLSASRYSYNDPEVAALMLDKVLEFSKGKNIERSLLRYLKESNARPLLKVL